MQLEPQIIQSWPDRCRLAVGSTFIFQGDHCTVTAMLSDHFLYEAQDTKPPKVRLMNYWFYLTTNAAIGRQLQNRK